MKLTKSVTKHCFKLADKTDQTSFLCQSRDSPAKAVIVSLPPPTRTSIKSVTSALLKACAHQILHFYDLEGTPFFSFEWDLKTSF